MSNLFYSEPAMRLTELLVSSSLSGRAFLCNSGAEANECAIKLVASTPMGAGSSAPRSSLDFAFHGRTLAALSRGRRASPARTSSARSRGAFVLGPATMLTPSAPPSTRTPRR